ncbi:MAG: pyrroline-5-carboxylate reductase [Candidatus Hydrogenedentota bacterium]
MIPGVIGFLGYGNMGTAILEGLIEAGRTTGKHALIYDTAPGRRQAAEAIGAEIAETPAELASKADTLLLAVKPQIMQEAVAPLAGRIHAETLVISIAAGITIARLTEWLGGGVRIIRVMPNTPALVSAGAAGIALGPGCTQADAAVACALFEGIGLAEVVDEPQLDAVTALSGSGPAYFFRLVECMEDAAVAEGLSRDQAARFAAQTLLGAGVLLTHSGESAGTLRQRVTSKGGTTEAALHTLQEKGFCDLVRAAVATAAARSRELGA